MVWSSIKRQRRYRERVIKVNNIYEYCRYSVGLRAEAFGIGNPDLYKDGNAEEGLRSIRNSLIGKIVDRIVVYKNGQEVKGFLVHKDLTNKRLIKYLIKVSKGALKLSKRDLDDYIYKTCRGNLDIRLHISKCNEITNPKDWKVRYIFFLSYCR